MMSDAGPLYDWTCMACGRPASQLPPDHECEVTEDAVTGHPVMICNYAVQQVTYTIPCWGAGGSGGPWPDPEENP